MGSGPMLYHTDSLFILLGSILGFGSLAWTIADCYFINPTGPWPIKLVMGPVLLIYMYNSVQLAFYLSYMFISYIPDKSLLEAYVHNFVKFLLSAVISLNAARLWISYRDSARCIRFAECPEETTFLIVWSNILTDSACGPPDKNLESDFCRRWVAQVPLIALTLLSMIMIYNVGQLWLNKFEAPTPATTAQDSVTSTPSDRERVAGSEKGSSITRLTQTPVVVTVEKVPPPRLVRLSEVIESTFR